MQWLQFRVISRNPNGLLQFFLNNFNAHTAFYNLKLLMWEKTRILLKWKATEKFSFALNIQKWFYATEAIKRKAKKIVKFICSAYSPHDFIVDQENVNEWMNELIERGRIFKYSSRRVVACWHGNLSLKYCNNFSAMNACADNLIEHFHRLTIYGKGRRQERHWHSFERKW